MDDTNYKAEINEIYKTLKDKAEDLDISPDKRREAKERIQEFEFVIKNRDIIDYKEFTTMNLSFPLYYQPIFEKHFKFLRDFISKNHLGRSTKITQCKFKFNHWRVYFTVDEHKTLPTMFYVLVDNLCSELEQSMIYKKK